jgi:penicillin-binding protein 1B
MTNVQDSPTPRFKGTWLRLKGWSRAHPWRVGVIALFVLLSIPAAAVYAIYYKAVSATLRAGPFANSSNIFSAPRVVMPGSALRAEQIVEGLERAGYSTNPSNQTGWYKLENAAIEVHPGPKSYFRPEPAVIKFKGEKEQSVSELESLRDGTKLERYSLEPELITNLVTGDREKRRLVRFENIPPVLVHAVVSAEDKRFFEHLGFDPFRLTKAAYVDLRSGRKEQGGSTISMQLARGLWLDPEKRWRRKFSEMMITLVLEQRLTKEEIFEYYANQIYLGRRDSFSIHGFGEAARAFFDKDISQLNLAEAALLAGMIQRPSYFNPFRNVERAKERRNLVLRLMHENGYIDAAQLAAASEAPIELSPRKLDLGDAPYFLALLNHELQARLPEVEDPEELGGTLQVYSTLDPDLQRAAVEAVRVTMPKIDKIVKARKIAKDGVLPQVALVALDPKTGEVKAVVGGRDYAESQLNHALSMRQPGSVFKPFVYAAALKTAVDGSGKVFTTMSTVNDAPTVFKFGKGQTYEPSNFGDTFYGTVTLRRAIAKSMNLATVSLAEKVGYERVVDLARKAGLNDKIYPTPAVALGAYEATPLEIAGAYTMFANRGEVSKPTFILRVTRGESETVLIGRQEPQRVLDERVAFLMNNLLEGVVRGGTAAAAGAQLKVPAAGKTGTSRDGWFAGYTPELLCVVWVGFDDNRELNIEGSKSALPIWTEFMKRAVQFNPVKQKFDPPPQGVVAVRVDPSSGRLAGPACGGGQQEFFIAGTQPRSQCQPQYDQYSTYSDAPIGSADRQALPVRPASMEMPARTPR